MGEISGLGSCGICGKPIQDPITGVPGPIRHFQGHLLAHKSCKEGWDEPEQRLRRAKESVVRLEASLASTLSILESARAEVEELEPK